MKDKDLGTCEFCEVEPALYENPEGNLCQECQDRYDSDNGGGHSGYCSLYCCVTGHCDDVC